MTRSRLAFIFPAALALLISHLPAQPTWNGLHFGASQAEVQQALRRKGVTLTEGNPGIYDVRPIHDLSLPDIKVSLPFRVQLTFSGGLKKVDLILDSNAAMQRMGNVYATVDLVVSSMANALTAKYGAPLDMTGICDLKSNNIVSLMLENGGANCKESWRTEGQLVSVSWWADNSPNPFIYTLTYEAYSTDLRVEGNDYCREILFFSMAAKIFSRLPAAITHCRRRFSPLSWLMRPGVTPNTTAVLTTPVSLMNSSILFSVILRPFLLSLGSKLG